MIQNFGFFRTTMSETREADYHLGCLDSSLFIDLNKSVDNSIALVRISFDGFGGCNLIERRKSLGRENSDLFIEEMKNEHLNQEAIANLVLKAIKNNKKNIWNDALRKYEWVCFTTFAKTQAQVHKNVLSLN